MKVQPKRPLRFSEVEIRNWRNFTQVSVALARRAFLVGANASGKSNFLDVFRFLRDIVSVGGGFQDAVRRRGGVSKLRSLAARRYPEISIRVALGDDETKAIWRYEIEFTQDNRQRPIIKREAITKGSTEVLARPDLRDGRDPERLTQTYLEQVNVNQEFREVADFFESVRYLHIVPQLVREPDRSVGRANDPFSGDFIEQVARTPAKTRDARLRRIREAVRVAVPQLKELELWRDPAVGSPHLRGKYEHWRPQGAWLMENQFSDGTLRLLGLLWAVQDGAGPLLLEEPELSLHPEVVRYIPQMFARAQRSSGRQICVSTHSPDLLRDEGIGLDEVLILASAPEGTTVRPAGSIEGIAELVREDSPIADAVIPYTRPQRAEQLSLALFGK